MHDFLRLGLHERSILSLMIRFIILLVLVVLALSYFGISIRHIVESPSGTDNLTYVWSLIQNGWDILVAWISGFAEGVRNSVS